MLAFQSHIEACIFSKHTEIPQQKYSVAFIAAVAAIWFVLRICKAGAGTGETPGLAFWTLGQPTAAETQLKIDTRLEGNPEQREELKKHGRGKDATCRITKIIIISF